MPRELILSFAITLLALLLTVVAFFILPPLVPLWYSLAIPEQRLVPKLFLFLFPIGMFLLTMIHMLIIKRLRSMDATIIKIFSYGTTLVTSLFFVALIHIVYVFL